VEEVGAMNIFFVIDGKLITPMLTGSILPGITRDSVIKLAKLWGLDVSERKISIHEVFDAYTAGKLDEIFGSGTAAVISPVGEIKYGEKIIAVGDGKVGPVANRFYTELTNIQYGKTEDPAGWIEPL
ncbi:MAG: aminotransferase class IV, partial [Deltaproteobacteria bacterium]|nr:aminotransferase class IV [Deltaproteobacteria bacterium]